VCWATSKVPTHYSFTEVNKTWNLLTDFWKILTYQISQKSVLWEPICTMRTDGRTDVTKQRVAFHNFAGVPKNVQITVPKGMLRTYNLTMFCVCVCVCVCSCVCVLCHFSILNQLNMGSNSGAKDRLQSYMWTDGRMDRQMDISWLVTFSLFTTALRTRIIKQKLNIQTLFRH
jgi:hypothetical protein